MNTSTLIEIIQQRYGRPIIKDNGRKILAHPYKFIYDGQNYTLIKNIERIGITELFSTPNEDFACTEFLKVLEKDS